MNKEISEMSINDVEKRWRDPQQFRAAVKANPRNADAVRELRVLEGRRGQGRR